MPYEVIQVGQLVVAEAVLLGPAERQEGIDAVLQGNCRVALEAVASLWAGMAYSVVIVGLAERDLDQALN